MVLIECHLSSKIASLLLYVKKDNDPLKS